MATVRFHHQLVSHRWRFLLIRLYLVSVDLEETTASVIVLLVRLTHLRERIVLMFGANADTTSISHIFSLS